MEYQSESAEQTEAFARSVGSRLRGGEVIELSSDLGGGKTTFVRGLAAGAGSKDHVASPTFTISREYTAGDITLHHYDFYRLAEDAGIMADELHDVLSDEKAVAIIEWSGAVEHVLPAERVRIVINRTGDDSRTFLVDSPEAYAYLWEEA